MPGSLDTTPAGIALCAPERAQSARTAANCLTSVPTTFTLLAIGVVDQRFFGRFTAARSDSMRPAMDRICVGVALPVRSALPAMLASALLGGFSGVVFLDILVLPFECFTCACSELATTWLLVSRRLLRAHLDFPAVCHRCWLQLGNLHVQHAVPKLCVDAVGCRVRRQPERPLEGAVFALGEEIGSTCLLMLKAFLALDVRLPSRQGCAEAHMFAAANQPCGISQPLPTLHQACVLTVPHRALRVVDRDQMTVRASSRAREVMVSDARRGLLPPRSMPRGARVRSLGLTGS